MDKPRPGAFLSATFSATAVEIELRFEVPVELSSTTAPQKGDSEARSSLEIVTQGGGSAMTCKASLSEESFRLVGGLDSSCLLKTPYVLSVTPGPKSPVMIGDALSLRHNAFFQRGHRRYLNPIPLVGTKLIRGHENPLQPDIHLSFPATHGACDGLELDVTGSTGSGGHPLRWQWSANAKSGGGTTLQLNDIYRLTGPKLSLPHNAFKPGHDYTVTVAATNFLNLTTTKSVVVSKARNDLPYVVLYGGSKRRIKAEEEFVIDARARSASCVKGHVLTYQWETEDPVIKKQYVKELRERKLRLPGYAFKQDKKYTFRLRVDEYLPGAVGETINKIIAAGKHTTSSVISRPVTLTTAPSSLGLMIIGGNRRLCSSDDKGYSLKVKTSLEIPPGLFSWRWKAYRNKVSAWDVAVGREGDSMSVWVPLTEAESKSLKQNGNDLYITTGLGSGVYRFEVETVGRASESAASTWIELSGKECLAVSVRGIGETRIINHHEGLHFDGRLGGLSDDSNDVSRSWRLISGPEMINWGPTYNRIIDHRANAYSLFLGPYALSAGGNYRFRLSATSGIGNGFAEVDVIVRDLPKGGSFEVTPLQGIAFDTVFNLTCSGWNSAELEDLPLRYGFRFERAHSSTAWLREPSLVNSLSTDAIPPGEGDRLEVHMVARIMDAVGAYQDVRRTVIVESPPGGGVSHEKILEGHFSSAEGDVEKSLALAATAVSGVKSRRSSAVSMTPRLHGPFLASLLTAEGGFMTPWLAKTITPLLRDCMQNPQGITLHHVVSAIGLIVNASSSLADAANLDGGADDEVAGAVVSALSNTIESLVSLDDSKSDELIKTTGKRVVKSLADISKARLRGAAYGGVALDSREFQASLQRQLGSMIHKGVINLGSKSDGGVKVMLPAGVLEAASGGRRSHGETTVDAHVMRYKWNPYSWNAGSASLQSDVVSVSLYDESGAEIPVYNLPPKQPIEISIPTYSIPSERLNLEVIRECVFWHTEREEWSNVGCEVKSFTAGETTCRCSHLTEFAINVVYRNRGQISQTTSLFTSAGQNKYGLLHLSRKDMKVGRVRILINATNILGQSRSNEVILDEAPEAERPVAFIVVPKDLRMFRGENTTLKAYSHAPECMDMSNYSLTYQWTVSPDLLLEPYSFTQKDFVIPAHSTITGDSYTFQLQVHMNNLTHKIGASSIQSVSLTSSSSALVASVTGGERSIPPGQDFVLYGSSQDNDMSDEPRLNTDTYIGTWDVPNPLFGKLYYDGAPSVTYSWSCQSPNGGTCVDLAQWGMHDELSLAFNSSHYANFVVDKRYVFTFTISKGNRTDSFITAVDIKDTHDRVQASWDTSGREYDSVLSSRNVPSSNYATLMANEHDPFIKYKWSVQQGAYTLPSSITTYSLDNKYFSITPQSLSAGGTYRFRLHASRERAGVTTTMGTSDVVLHSNLAPWSGELKSSQLIGNVFETRFGLSAVGFVDDPEDYPLLYSFSANHHSHVSGEHGEEYPLSRRSYRNHFTVAALPLGDDAGHGCQYIGVMIQCFGAVRVHVDVMDNQGAVSRKSTSVTVTTRYFEQDKISQWVMDNTQPQVTHYKKLGDMEGELQTIHGLASILNVAGPYGTGTLADELQARELLLDKITGSIPMDLYIPVPTPAPPPVINCTWVGDRSRCCQNVTYQELTGWPLNNSEIGELRLNWNGTLVDVIPKPHILINGTNQTDWRLDNRDNYTLSCNDTTNRTGWNETEDPNGTNLTYTESCEKIYPDPVYIVTLCNDRDPSCPMHEGWGADARYMVEANPPYCCNLPEIRDVRWVWDERAAYNTTHTRTESNIYEKGVNWTNTTDNVTTIIPMNFTNTTVYTWIITTPFVNASHWDYTYAYWVCNDPPKYIPVEGKAYRDTYEHHSASAALAMTLYANMSSGATNAEHSQNMVHKALSHINGEVNQKSSHGEVDIATSLVHAMDGLVNAQIWKTGEGQAAGMNTSFGIYMFEHIYNFSWALANQLVEKRPIGETAVTINSTSVRIAAMKVDNAANFHIEIPRTGAEVQGVTASGNTMGTPFEDVNLVMMYQRSTIHIKQVETNSLASDVVTFAALPAQSNVNTSHGLPGIDTRLTVANYSQSFLTVSIFFPLTATQLASVGSLVCRYYYEPESLWTGENCITTPSETGITCACVRPNGKEFALHQREGCFICRADPNAGVGEYWGNTGTWCCNGATCNRDGSCSCAPRGFPIYRGTSCEIKCPGSRGLTVAESAVCTNGQGICTDAGKCVCNEGYRGSACEYNCPRGGGGIWNNATCSGNGAAVDQGCSAVGVCTCAPAVQTDIGLVIQYPYTYNGRLERTPTLTNPITYTHSYTYTKVSLPLYINDNCNVTCPVDEFGRYCSGKGHCDELGKCQCNLGYSGPECNVAMFQQSLCKACINGTWCCNGGTCDSPKIAATGFGCACATGYRGVMCQASCPRENNKVCNGPENGACDMFGVCQCLPHAKKSKCEKLCPRWPATTTGAICNGKGDPTVGIGGTDNPPTGNGCDDEGNCRCIAGWRLNACQLECPKSFNSVTGLNETCGGHGTCNVNGNCECDKATGWRGKACELRCPMDWQADPPSVCYGSGTCDDNAKCHCNRGYMGEMCNVGCSICPASGKLCCFGSCHYDGRCMCKTVDGVRYVGSTCEVPWSVQHTEAPTDVMLEYLRNHTMANEEKYITIDGTGLKHGICMPKMRLNGPQANRAGWFWHNQTQSVLGGFTTKFQIQMLDRSLRCRTIRNNQGNTFFYEHCHDHGADGMAFVIRGPGSAQGGESGREQGYGGINNSIAIEFDTWWNGEYEEKLGGAGHIGINTRGHVANNASHKHSLASAPFESVRNSLVKTVIVRYTPELFSLESVHEDVIDNDRLLASTPGHLLGDKALWPWLSSKNVGTLEVFIDNLENPDISLNTPLITIPLDLGKVIHSADGKAFVGFTSGTASYFQTHDVLQWYWCEGRNCTDKAWLQNETMNEESYCKEKPCPRGYPWHMYPERVSTTEIGSTT